MIDLFSPETYQAFEEWIVANPGWAGLSIMCISMCESLAVIGLFIPGLIAMGIIGGLVSAGVLELFPTLMWAVIGAVIGDGVSYSIGRHFKQHLPYYWPFSRFPKWLARGETFFVKHGGKSIIVGRFVGPVRPFIPVVAGMMSMDPRQFFLANVLSALVWAPVYMAPGFGITWLLF